MSGYRRVVLTVASAVLAAACVAAASPAWLDGHQVEGVWVSNESFPCPFGDRCDAATAVARSALLARDPSAKIGSVSYHRPPVKSTDPRILGVSSMPFHEFVLTLGDGSERVEAFGCGIGGELTAGSAEGFAQFCPKPDTGPPSTTVVDLVGQGSMSWTHHLDAGRYGFGWWTTSAARSCDGRLVLEGPDGSTLLSGRHLDPYMSWGSGDVSNLPTPSAGSAVLVDVTTGSQAPSSAPGTILPAGTYTVHLDTDCPGESHLWVSRYDGS